MYNSRTSTKASSVMKNCGDILGDWDGRGGSGRGAAVASTSQAARPLLGRGFLTLTGRGGSGRGAAVASASQAARLLLGRFRTFWCAPLFSTSLVPTAALAAPSWQPPSCFQGVGLGAGLLGRRYRRDNSRIYCDVVS
jgi:hypothetical protein